MRKTWWATLAVALLLGVGTTGSAQETSAGGGKPVLTVVFAGYESFTGNLDTIGKMAGRPEASKMLDGLLMMATKGKGLAGLDKSRPWVATVYGVEEGKIPPFHAFIPATDLKQLIGLIPDPEMKPDAEGVYEVKSPQGAVYLQQKGNWAVVAESRDALKSAPAEPSAAAAELTKKYVLAAKVSMQNLPEDIRKKVVSEMQSSATQALERQPGEDDDQYALRTNATKKALAKFTALINDLDEVLLGLAVDGASNALHLDLDITAKAGTPTAQQFAGVKDTKTNFAGFLAPGAAVTAVSSGELSDEDVAEAKAYLDQMRKTTAKEIDANEELTKEQQQLANRLIGDVIDVLQKTVELKKMDAGMAITLEPGAPALFVGATLAEGKKLEKVVKDLVAEAGKEQPGVAELVKLDADKQDGVNLHVATIPVPDDVAAMVGEKVEIVVGIGDDSAYVGVGKNAVKGLKEIIQKSKAEAGKSVPAMQLTIAAAPIAKFVAQSVPFPPVQQQAEAMAKALGEAAGKDRVVVVSRVIANGVGARLTVEEGILKVIGTQVPGGPGAAPGGPGGGPDGPDGKAPEDAPKPKGDNPF